MRSRYYRLAGIAVLALLLVACQGYTETGARSSDRQGADGGILTVEIERANGSSEKSIELQGGAGVALDAHVTLAVGMGSYKIELLGAGGEVTLALEARAGETVEGQGLMVADSFGEASYRISAQEAGKVTYVIEYTFR